MAGGSLIALLAAAQAPAELPRITQSLPCLGLADEIVVCARPPSERYRIPPELRAEPLDPRHYSWSGRARDEREAGRFDGATVGPNGVFLDSRRIDCAWRAERQELADQMIDCSQRVRPD